MSLYYKHLRRAEFFHRALALWRDGTRLKPRNPELNGGSKAKILFYE